MTATILGVRGIARTNPLFRGFGVAALVLGIIEIAVTTIFGLIFFCCSLGLLAHGGMG